MKHISTSSDKSFRNGGRGNQTTSGAAKSLQTQQRAAGRSRRPSVLVFGTLLAGLVVVGGYALLRGWGGSSGDVSVRAPAGLGSLNSRLRELLWPVKAQASYRIEQSINLEAGDADMVPDACGLTTVAGQLHVGLLEVNAKSVTLAMQLSGVTLTTGDAAGSERRHEPVMESMLNGQSPSASVNLLGPVTYTWY